MKNLLNDYSKLKSNYDDDKKNLIQLLNSTLDMNHTELKELSDKIKNEALKKLENDKNFINWIHNFSIENSWYVEFNSDNGIDFHYDLSDYNEFFKSIPSELLDSILEEFSDNYSVYFNVSKKDYYSTAIISTCDEAFINCKNELIFNRKFYSNNSFIQALIKFNTLCDESGYYPGLYSYSSYNASDSINEFIHVNNYLNEVITNNKNNMALIDELFSIDLNCNYYVEGLFNLLSTYSYSIDLKLTDEDNYIEEIEIDEDSLKTDTIKFSIKYYDELNQESKSFDAIITLKE